MKQYQKTLLVWLVFGLFIVTVWSLFGKSGPVRAEKPFSEVVSALEAGQVKSITIMGQEFTGDFKDGTQFRSTGVVTDRLMTNLEKANKEYGTEYLLKKEEVGTFWVVLAQWLPMLNYRPLYVLYAPNPGWRRKSHVFW